VARVRRGELVEAVVIPVVIFGGAFAVTIVAMVLRFRTRDRMRLERMQLAEKGLPIPNELYQAPRERREYNGYRIARAWLLVLGVLLVFIGFGVLIGVSAMEGMHEGLAGIIVIMIGVGFLAAERFVRRLGNEAKVEREQIP
jgi:hypothetical protein